MKRLSEDLKRILTGLAYQDVGEFLPMHDKIKVLGFGANPKAKTSLPAQGMTNIPEEKRIAFITEGRGMGALKYATDACSRLGANIDLLLHNVLSPGITTVLINSICAANLRYNCITLKDNPVENIVEYINNHPSLILLVATRDDNIAKVLAEEVIPKRGRQFPIMLALIEDLPSNKPAKQSMVTAKPI
jgi:hypothetical protein